MLDIFSSLWPRIIAPEHWPGRIFFKDRLNAILLIAGGLLALGQWLMMIWQVRPTADVLPLHYNIFFGVDYVGQWYQAYYAPLLSVVIFGVNLLVAMIFYKREKNLSYLILSATVFLMLLSSIAALNIIFLVS